MAFTNGDFDFENMTNWFVLNPETMPENIGRVRRLPVYAKITIDQRSITIPTILTYFGNNEPCYC